MLSKLFYKIEIARFNKLSQSKKNTPENKKKLNEALLEAASNGKAEEVKRLLKAGADATATQRPHEFTALHLAAIGKNFQRSTPTGADYIACAKALLEAGADIEAKGCDGSTPLIQATKTNDADLVKTLLEAGAKLNTEDENGCTALHFAADNGHIKSLLVLLKFGANINYQNSLGSTPLHWAVEGQKAMEEALIDYGTESCNILETKERYLKCIQALLRDGANLEIKNKAGDTALDLASTLGLSEPVDIITSAIEQRKTRQKRPSTHPLLTVTQSSSTQTPKSNKKQRTDKRTGTGSAAAAAGSS